MEIKVFKDINKEKNKYPYFYHADLATVNFLMSSFLIFFSFKRNKNCRVTGREAKTIHAHCKVFRLRKKYKDSFTQIFIERPSGTNTVPDTEGTGDNKTDKKIPAFMEYTLGGKITNKKSSKLYSMLDDDKCYREK